METARAWTTVGFVQSKTEGGTPSDPERVRDYRYAVENLAAGTHQFRLQQVDVDGTSHRSDPVTVELRMEEPLRLSAPAPNPVQRKATLSFTVKEKRETTLRLYNTLGQRVAMLYHGTPTAGETQTVRIRASHLSGLPSGVYFLRLRAGNRTRRERVTVVR